MVTSSFNFKNQYLALKQGYTIGIENYVFVKKETTVGVFSAPVNGSAGLTTSSASAAAASLAAGGDVRDFNIQVDGQASLNVRVGVDATNSAKQYTTPAAIAAAMQAAINNAVAGAGQSGGVVVDYGVTNATKITIKSINYGIGSSIALTVGTLEDLLITVLLAADVPAAGVQGDFLWCINSSIKYAQDIELSQHRSGRQGQDIIKKKKMVDGNIEMYLNFMETSAKPIIDEPVAMLIEQIMGKRTGVIGTDTSIVFDASNPPTSYFTIVQCNNSMNRISVGAYCKNLTFTFPGDGVATVKCDFKGRDAFEAGIAKASAIGGVDGSAILQAGEANNYTTFGRVMVIDGTDGVTVKGGDTGNWYVKSRSIAEDKVIIYTSTPDPDVAVDLSAIIAVGDFLVPWSPQVFGFGGVNNPVTGLTGQLKFGSEQVEEITSVEIGFNPNFTDLDNYYGYDTNRGYIVGGRAEITCKVTFNLSGSQIKKLNAIKNFSSFEMKLILGRETDDAGAAARHMEIYMPHVKYKPVSPELPAEGPVPVTLEGLCLQAAGQLDAIRITYK